MAKSVTLEKSKRFWRTQGDAKEHFKKMLSRYQVGQSVSPGGDHDDLSALLEIYDTTGEKRGTGVDSFFLDRDREHGGTTNCFYVRRVDGTEIDFSVHKAVAYASQVQAKK